MKLLSLFFSFVGLFPLVAEAQELELKNKLETLTKVFQLPSLSAAHFKNGKLVEIDTFGIRKFGYNVKTTIYDKHHLGSCTKSINAMLAGKLIDLGYLSWNSTLSELLPKTQIHEKLKNISFELLLSHRSGIKRDINEENNIYQILDPKTMTPTEARSKITNKILKEKPKFKPNKGFHYSNIAYIISGYILEHLTSKSWEDLIKKYIFSPLEMRSCGFGPVSELQNINQPWGHRLENNNLIPYHNDNPPVYAPAANIHCSLQDWAKYLQVQIDGYNKRSNFLKQITFDKLHSSFPSKDISYTYGGWFKLEKNWANGFALWHTGTNTYNFANAWVAPKTNSIFISTTNVSSEEAFKATDQAIWYLIQKSIKKKF